MSLLDSCNVLCYYYYYHYYYYYYYYYYTFWLRRAYNIGD